MNASNASSRVIPFFIDFLIKSFIVDFFIPTLTSHQTLLMVEQVVLKGDSVEWSLQPFDSKNTNKRSNIRKSMKKGRGSCQKTGCTGKDIGEKAVDRRDIAGICRKRVFMGVGKGEIQQFDPLLRLLFSKCFLSVSYTHLDVYKRQVSDCSSSPEKYLGSFSSILFLLY